jgi:hypothetical protein
MTETEAEILAHLAVMRKQLEVLPELHARLTALEHFKIKAVSWGSAIGFVLSTVLHLAKDWIK